MNRFKARTARSFKALGLSLVAALALGAVVTSAAQAEGKFIAGKYPAALTGTSTTPHTFTMAGGAREITCNSATFSGELAAASEAVAISSVYTACFSKPGSVPIWILANGCSYTWSVAKLESPTTASGAEALNCPAGKEYEYYVFENAMKQVEGIPMCIYGIPPQGAVSTLSYTNQGSGSTANVDVTRNVTGLTVNVKKGLKLLCGAKTGETTTGAYTGSLNLVAKNGGVQTSLKVG